MRPSSDDRSVPRRDAKGRGRGAAGTTRRNDDVRAAAATVGALASELIGDRLAVVAFWSDAAVLLRLGDAVRPGQLLDRLLRMPVQGLTNLAFPLQLARQEVSQSAARNPSVLLLSERVHNAGPDPRPLAARLPRLGSPPRRDG